MCTLLEKEPKVKVKHITKKYRGDESIDADSDDIDKDHFDIARKYIEK